MSSSRSSKVHVRQHRPGNVHPVQPQVRPVERSLSERRRTGSQVPGSPAAASPKNAELRSKLAAASTELHALRDVAGNLCSSVLARVDDDDVRAAAYALLHHLHPETK